VPPVLNFTSSNSGPDCGIAPLRRGAWPTRWATRDARMRVTFRLSPGYHQVTVTRLPSPRLPSPGSPGFP